TIFLSITFSRATASAICINSNLLALTAMGLLRVAHTRRCALGVIVSRRFVVSGWTFGPSVVSLR
ncbi:MAG: hypothetical protein AAFO68_00235, partial [Pseudomonadota bacterium]